MSDSTLITQISDNVNQGYIAGRDLYLGDQYVAQETLFFEPDLTNVEPSTWITTPKAGELSRALATHRLIVLAGQDMDDKTMVARHLAWLLRQELSGPVRVREWYRSSDPQKIETAFHETDTTILLLPQILPHHIGHRLNELGRVLHARHNYAVITTDGTRADWGIRSGSTEESLWREISWESYYGRPFLAETLLAELASLNGRRPDWLPKDPQPGSLFAEGLTVEEVAARLKQPERIQQFVQWIQSEEASSRTFLAQLDQLGGDRAAIHQWYRQLDRADQLLALGIILFDGLPDDQVFAALEILVREAWRLSDPNLPLFDYRDLQRLSAYCRIAESGEDGSRIETPSRQKREAILRAAWELQRRRLLAAVPAITHLLREILSNGHPAEVEPATRDKSQPSERRWLTRKAKPNTQEAPENPELWRLTRSVQRELFSSSRRLEQLQRSIIEDLSQIGLLSFEAVEASFLELAMSGSVELQTVVAKALAAWRGEGHSEQLFRILHAWWTDGCLATPAKSLAQRIIRPGEDPRATMRATVALTVGYALQYDRPNQLSPELLSLLTVLLQDRHPAVHVRVLELTLPLATASHLRQLEPLLRSQIDRGQELMYAIAFGMAMAFSLRPAESLEVIERWHAFGRALSHPEHDALAVTPRERLLSVSALAYGYIRCDQSQGLLSPDQVVSSLRSILAAETNPFVRTHALVAMGLQAVENFDLISSTLMELISEVTLADRLHVVSVLTRAYLKQREHLEGGDEELEIGGHTYRVWTRSPRPLTSIETALYSWLRNEHHPVAQQVAMQTFAAIAGTELDQQERAMAFRPLPMADSTPPSVLRLAPNPQRLRRSGLLGRLAVAAAAPRRKETRALLLPIMAEAIAVRRNGLQRPLLPMILARWHAMGEEEIQPLVRKLGIALDFFRWRWAILLALIVSCGLLIHDVRDWRRAFSASFSAEEQLTIRQRAAAPLRLAWKMSVPRLRQLEELRRQEEERRRAALERSSSRRPQGSPRDTGQIRDIDVRDDTPSSPPEVSEEIAATLLTPAERLRLSAALILARLSNQDFLSLLLSIQELQAAAEQETGRLEVLATPEPREIPAAPQPRPRVSSEVERTETAPGTPTSATPSRLNPPAIIPAAVEPLLGKPDRETTEVDQAAPSIEPDSKPSWRQKLRMRKKKKPPAGENP